MKPTPETLARMKAVVGAKGVVAEGDIAPYLVERRELYVGRAAAVLRPASTQEVSALLKIAHETGTAIVPQGGNTGLVVGSVPDDSGTQVVLSLTRMNAVRAIDGANRPSWRASWPGPVCSCWQWWPRGPSGLAPNANRIWLRRP